MAADSETLSFNLSITIISIICGPWFVPCHFVSKIVKTPRLYFYWKCIGIKKEGILKNDFIRSKTCKRSMFRFLNLHMGVIGPISGATTPSQSGPGSDGNKGVLRIPQSSSISGTSSSDCLVSYPGHSAEVQSVYSTAPADWAISLYI